jgi:hypothetical protein
MMPRPAIPTIAIAALVIAALLVLGGCDGREHAPPPSHDDTRFTKLDASGRAMPVDAGPWACIRDESTGLSWENKTDNELLHYAAATYSWFDPGRGLGYPDRGSCHEDQAQFPCDTDDLLRESNARRLCGFDDWRLPAGGELRTLVTHDVRANEATIIDCFFPYTQRSPYWTTDVRRNAQGDLEVSAVNFVDGATVWLPVHRLARARLVRGP